MGWGSNVMPRKFGRDIRTPHAWPCSCKAFQPKHRANCPDCGDRRPDPTR